MAKTKFETVGENVAQGFISAEKKFQEVRSGKYCLFGQPVGTSSSPLETGWASVRGLVL